MPLRINLSDYGQTSLNNLALIAGSMNGEVLPGAGIRDRAMIGDVGLNRTTYPRGTFGASGADGATGAALYLTDPKQFSTWLPSEGAAYKNATGMRDAVLAVAANPAAFDSLSPQMQQNMLASLAATRGVYGTGELRGISGGSTMYSNTSVLSAGRAAEHEKYGSDLGVNVGGNTFYGINPDNSAQVANAIRGYDVNGSISTTANNLPADLATPYRQRQPNLFQPQGQGFDPGSATNPGVPDSRGDYTTGAPNFGAGISPTDYDSVRNPANPLAYIPEGGPPGRPDGIVPEANPLDTFSDAITHGVEGVGGFLGGLAGSAASAFKGVFDPAAYDAANPDVAAAQVDPLQHYLTYGYQEGRALDPQGDRINQGFNPSAYLAANPDVAASGANPLLHYLQYGAHEGRTADFSGNTAPGNFGAGIYQPANIDTLGLDPAASIFRPGQINADFSGSPLDPAPIATSGGFDPSAYLLANPDVAAAGVDPLQHWLRYGQAEGRPLTPQGPAANVSPTAFGGGFDPSAYLQANPDVAAAGVDPLQHWLRYGQAEGRPLTPNANPFTGNANGAPDPISADFSGSPLSPIDPGNPIAYPDAIQGNFGSPLAPVPTGPNVSQSVAPGTFQGTFNGADYLAANQDLAGLNVDPLQHYLSYGYQEGRALDTAGDRISQGFNPSQYLAANPDVAASGVSPLQHYLQYGAHEGRATNFSGGVAPGSFGAGIVPAPSMQSPMDYGALGSIDVPAPIAGGNFGADLSPVSTGPNVSASVGPGTFHGTFNGADYLAANQDVAAANVDPLTHYLTYGFNEGRAIDTAGDRINRGFDPTQYLATNPDVAAAHVDPLRHYLESGAAEGRALPTGSNPYSFANFNASQGLGPVANGAMGFGGLGSMGGGQGMPDLGYDGGGFDASGGVPNGSFGLGGITAGSPNYGGGYSPFNGGFNPYGFSGANVGGGLGATAQSMGGYYPAGGGQGGGIDPYGFSQANVSGFDPNSFGGGAPVEDFGSGAGLGPTQWSDAPQAGGDGGGGASGFDHNASELAFLRGQMDQLAARDAALAASNNANIGFANASAARSGQLDAVGAGNAAKQFAGIQSGLGIAPVAGTSFFTPAPPISFGGIGPMLPPLRAFL